MNKGKVYLIGAGPGDPGLITVKGLKILKMAEVVVYDRLSSPLLLEEVKEGCELIYRANLSQEQINQILAEKAGEGKLVVRLKGGDPFLFSRGVEEALYLKERGIDFEVIPGVSSALAVPEVAGIPLTHRDYASSVIIATGHEAPDKEKKRVDWRKIAKTADTIVILMGVEKLPYIVEELIKGGKQEKTPAAIVYRGTTSSQKTILTTLENLVDKVKEEEITSHSIVIVGEAVKLGQKLNPLSSSKPLSNKRILVTTPQEKLKTLLELEGAEVIHFPTILLKPVEENYLLDKAIESISTYNWIIFTSAAAVDFFWKRLEERGKDSRYLKGLKIAAIGPVTANRLREKGIVADIVPEDYSTQGLIKKLEELNLRDQSFLLPRSSIANPLLGKELQKRGAKVKEIKLYSTEPASLPSTVVNKIYNELCQGRIDLVTFTSGSTLLSFLKLLGKECLSAIKVACIGPATAKIAEENGISVNIISPLYTFEGLVQAIKDYYKDKI